MADQSAGFAHRNMSSVHKSVLLELINMMLSSDNHTRAQAEKRVKAMESIRGMTPFLVTYRSAQLLSATFDFFVLILTSSILTQVAYYNIVL